MTPREILRQKKTLPTDLRTRELRRLPLWLREQSFFMAGVMNETLLGSFREAAQAVADGRLSEAEATRIIRDGLKAADYKPAPGQEGTIKDLSTLKRQLVTLRTNVALVQGMASEARQYAARAAFPAKELYRFNPKKKPRHWQTVLWPQAAARRNGMHPALPPLKPDNMMAPLGDDIWAMLSDFKAPYDPLKFNTGMRQRPVGTRAALAAGIITPDSLRAMVTGGDPVSSPGEAVELPAAKSAEVNARIKQRLGGLAEWRGDAIIFTDPNGTRPATPEALATVITEPNADGSGTNYQLEALTEWKRLGGDAAAMEEMRKLHAGTDLLDDFNRLVRRMQRARAGSTALDLLANLALLLLP